MKKKLAFLLVTVMLLILSSGFFSTAIGASLLMSSESFEVQSDETNGIKHLSSQTDKREKIETTAEIKHRGDGGGVYSETSTPEDYSMEFILGGVGVALIVVAVVIIILKARKNKKTKTFSDNEEPTIATQPLDCPDEKVGLQSTPGVSGRISVTGIGGYMGGRTYNIDEVVVSVGRSQECAIRYPEGAEGISKIHCKIINKKGSVFVEDKSTYGTYLQNGERLTEGKLYEMNDGDVIYLARKENAFRINKGV